MAKNTILDGIAASEHLDSSGESLSIEGMDISSLGGPDSILNWEHNSKTKPSQVVGKVTFAKKLLKAADAKTKREKYFWNKVKKPMVYIKAELFDGIGHSGAQDVAAMLKYKNKDKGEDSRLVVGFSIEGGKMEKKGMVVTKSIARDVAITVKPCNKICDAELIEGNVDEDFLYKNQDFDCEIIQKGGLSLRKSFRDLIIEDIKKSLPSKDDFNANAKRMMDTNSFKQKGEIAERIADKASKPLNLQDGAKAKRKFDHKTENPSDKVEKDTVAVKEVAYNRKSEVFKNEKNNMRKALMAGMMGGSPDSKTGGAALASEDLSSTLEKPFRSKKQRRFAHANPEKFGGKEGIKEWEEETPKNIPEKVKKNTNYTHKRMKKSEKLEKMSRPLMINKELGLGQDPRMDVKSVNPEKTYTTKRGKVVSQPELETKKIRQQYRNKEKEISGIKPGYEFTPKAQKEIKQYQKRFEIDPETSKAVNIYDPDYNINRSYTYKQKDGVKNEIGPEIHETTHGFFSDVSSKYGEDKSQKLSRHLLDSFFHPKDLDNIKQFVSSRYSEDYPHLQEEHITHIADIINRPSVRKEFLDKYSNLKKLKPDASLEDKKLAQDLDRRNYKRLTSGWAKSVNFIKDSKKLSDFLKNK